MKTLMIILTMLSVQVLTTSQAQNTEWKPYEDYRCITDTSSRAYQELQLANDNDKDGYMQIDGYYCVAMGSYFGTVGDELTLILEDDKIIPVIICDMKQDIHTDNNNIYAQNGHVVEFIVNTDNLPGYIQNSGTVGVDEKLEGKIKSIRKIKEWRI